MSNDVKEGSVVQLHQGMKDKFGRRDCYQVPSFTGGIQILFGGCKVKAAFGSFSRQQKCRESSFKSKSSNSRNHH